VLDHLPPILWPYRCHYANSWHTQALRPGVLQAPAPPPHPPSLTLTASTLLPATTSLCTSSAAAC
jgi:hypothetical protein